MSEYKKEKLWELYEMLPEELKTAVFSVKNVDHIEDICQKNKIQDREKIAQIGKNVTYVLLGILPPDEFQKKIEKDAKIKTEIAKNIALWINRLIFLPVRPALEGIYRMSIESQSPEKENVSQEKEKKPDAYREKIE